LLRQTLEDGTVTHRPLEHAAVVSDELHAGSSHESVSVHVLTEHGLNWECRSYDWSPIGVDRQTPDGV
jgi:hypothetical protein